MPNINHNLSDTSMTTPCAPAGENMAILATKDTYKGCQFNPLSQNKYLYVEGNPVNSIDPFGNIRMCIDEHGNVYPCQPPMWSCSNNPCDCSPGCLGPLHGSMKKNIYTTSWLAHYTSNDIADYGNDHWLDAFNIRPSYSFFTRSGYDGYNPWYENIGMCANISIELNFKVADMIQLIRWVDLGTIGWSWPGAVVAGFGNYICSWTNNQAMRFDDILYKVYIYNNCRPSEPPLIVDRDSNGRIYSAKDFFNEGYGGGGSQYDTYGFECSIPGQNLLTN